MTNESLLRDFIASLDSEDAIDDAIHRLRIARRDFIRRQHAEARAKDTSKRDVHTEHCCVRHGCCYGYDQEGVDVLDEDGNRKTCTVSSGEKIQSHVWDTWGGCCRDDHLEDDYG